MLLYNTIDTSPLPATSSPSFVLPNAAYLVLNVLESQGYEAWIVGGFVRDALLGKPGHDIDIATNAPWRDVKSACEEAGMRVYETGAAHGTVTVVVPAELLDSDPVDLSGMSVESSAELDYSSQQNNTVSSSLSFEITTYRHDGIYDDARHPRDVAFVSTIEEDLSRRDFTINALAFHPKRGVIDPFNGMEDLRGGVIRTVGEPNKRFAEDALRMLRACRFSSQLGFQIDPETYQAMVSHKSLLSKVSTERVTHELDELLLGKYAGSALLSTVDVLAFVLPELAAMKGCEQRTKYHKYDVLGHTACVVDHAQPTRLNRWAALCHDMGKPAAAFFDSEGVEHFYGHAQVSEIMTKHIMDRLLVSNTFKHHVMTLVKYHDADVDATPCNVRRLLLKLNGDVELFRALCDLKRADALAHATDYQQEGVDRANQLLAALDRVLEEEGTPSLSALAINGKDIMALGVSEGPDVGRILSALLAEYIDELVPNEHEALLARARILRDQR